MGSIEARARRERAEARIAAIGAGGLFLLSTSVALAGADRPPPLRFVWLVVALAGLSGLAHLRLKHHLGARRVSGGGQAAAAGLEGSLAGLALWLFLLVVGGGEPSVTPSLLDRMIGFGVMGTLGAACALALWSMAAWMQGRVPACSRTLQD